LRWQSRRAADTVRVHSKPESIVVQQIDQVLVPVAKLEPGMFPSESAITLQTSDGNTLTLFADHRLIVDRENRKFLRVTRLEENHAEGVSICLLPSDSAEGTRWIRMRSNELLAA